MENINLVMDFSNPVFKILIALFLGAFVGMRREMELQKKGISGIRGLRTSAFIVVMATVSTLFPEFSYLPIIFLVFLSVGVVTSYIAGLKKGLIGWTTEISLILLFLAGLFIGYEKFVLGILLAFIVAISDAYKNSLHNFASKINLKEWSGALQMLLMILVITPFLPKEAIDPWGIIIPYNIWMLIILVSGIGFVGYFLNKKFSNSKIKGVYFTSLIGAILSSTAVTVELSQKHKTKKEVPTYFIPVILLAIIIMEIRDALIILLALQKFDFKLLATPILMTITALIFFGYYFWKDTKKKQGKIDLKEKSPFEILPAIKFATVFVVILFIVYFVKKYAGDSGIYLATFIVSLVDTETIILPGIESFKNGVFNLELLSNVITISIVVNTLIKLFYIGFFGNLNLFKKSVWVIGLVSLIGLIPLLFWGIFK